MLKQRRVRQSDRFKARWTTSTRRRREHVASLYSTATIQAFLAGFLVLAAFRSLGMMQSKFPNLVWYLKYALPLLMLVVAGIAARMFAINLQRAWHYHRSPPKTEY